MSNLQVYIRHPDDIPIELQQLSHPLPLTNFSQRLGLICHSQTMLNEGTDVALCVPFVAPSISVSGRINWCRKLDSGFEVGINFESVDASMRVRMLEQLCRIHQYRLHVCQEQGRSLSEEDAALEWIERYAALFPSDGV